MTAEPLALPEDTKDWTWVIAQGCPECGWAPPPSTEIALRVRATVPRWHAVLRRPDVAARTRPERWSALEYGCHARDVCRVFDGRLTQLLTEDEPTFADWDQDAAARDGHYFAEDPATVSDAYAEAAGRIAAGFDAVRDDQWQRRGTRSNGSEFTVATLGAYFLHDLEHHLADVAG
ncbi:MAG: DinB family protein [Micropruina sp.]|uniref:DinB family protein n=1 Tax=Micropruina sp. TaxID=2737536 RepID=UPI0039E6144B